MKRVFFTGGSGKAGRHVINYLLKKKYKVLNFDLNPLENSTVNNIIGDITFSGQIYNTLTDYMNIEELKSDKLNINNYFDAVVHFAAIPRKLLKSDDETFRVNTIGTYNVIEAAVKLGIKKIIIASSETTYGVCFANGNILPKFLPIEEDYDVNPMDSYGLSKVVNEKTARAFQLRSGLDIYALRIGNVFEPDEYHRFLEFFKKPELRLRNLFNYMDARDLGQIIELCLKKDNLGFQIFNAANNTNSVNIPTKEIINSFYPNVEIRRTFGEFEAIYSNKKIRDILKFKENHNWRKYVKFN